MYIFKVITLANAKNKAIGDTHFSCFQDGAIMPWVSNQTNLPATLTNTPFDEMKPLANFRL
jgi:hypothetical protein